VLIAALALWVVYLVGVNIVLNSGLLPPLVAPNPERTTMSWERAWTVVPGLFHASGFKLRSHTRGILWNLTVDEGHVLVNLFALPFRCFQAVSARASGIDWELGEADTVLPRKQKKKPGFRILIHRAKASGIRSLTLNGMTLEGPIRAGGGVDTRARGPLKVRKAWLEVENTTLRFGEDVLASELDLEARASIDRHVPRDDPEKGLLPFLVARAEVKGQIADLSILNELLKGTRSVSFSGGSGEVDADIRLDRGIIEPESRLVTERATYTVDYLTYRATGTGRITLLSAADRSIQEKLRFELETYNLAMVEEETPYLSGTDLLLSLRGEGGMHLVGERPPLDVVIDMPESEVKDMTVYNHNLPPKTGIQILSGSGTLTAHLELLERSGGGGGEMELRADGIVVDMKGREIVGDLAVSSRAQIIDYEEGIVDPSGTRVEFRNAGVFVDDPESEPDTEDVEDEADWWGMVEIPAGQVIVKKPVSMQADFTIEADNAGPVFALFAKTQKQADKLDRKLKTEDLTGSGRVDLGEGRVAITDLEVEGGKARILADLCFQEGGVFGLVHAKYGVLAVAAELQGQEETLHVTSPKKWFERNRPDFACPQ